MNLVLPLLVFPGVLFTLVLTVALQVLVEGLPRGRLAFPKPGLESLIGLLSIVLACVGMALLPWPIQLWVAREPAQPLAIWLAIEAAFWLPFLPGLLSRDTLINRVTMREAQVSLAGRVVVWLAIGSLMAQAQAWSLTSAPGRLLVVIAGFLALPAAMSVGPFAADRNLSPSGAEHGLDSATGAWLRFARQVRSTVLLAALALAILPRDRVQPLAALAVWAAIVVVVGLVLRRISGTLPRLTLPTALRWCWWRALPIALVGLVYLVLVP